MASTIVKFNRKFTSAQLAAAENTGTIAGQAVVNGTLYIAKDGDGIYLGDGNGILKLIGQKNANTIDGHDITNLINAYLEDEAAVLINRVDYANSANFADIAGQADADGNGNTIADTYKVKQTAKSSPSASGSTTAFIDTISQDAEGVITATKKNIDFSGLAGTITKTAGSASGSTAAASYQKVPVVSGFVLRETAGKLVETNAASNPSTVTTVEVDVAGSAQKALNDAKDYTDEKITGLGSIMHFEGTVATEAALKALTNVKKGDVYVVTADRSEWIATADIGATADPTKWEKFGTTDVQGALYKNTTGEFVSGGLVYANGTNGATNTIGSYAPATGLNLTNVAVTVDNLTAEGNVEVDGSISAADGIITSSDLTVEGASEFWDSVKIGHDGHDSALQVNKIQSLEGDGTGYDAIVISPADTNGTVTIGSSGLKVALDGILGDPVVKNPDGEYKILHSGVQSLSSTEKTQVLTNIGAQAAGSYKTTQTAVTPAAGTVVGVADGQYVEQVTQNTNGVITVTRKKLPDFQGSGSVGSASAASDAWKTVVHDASLSVSRVLSGNTVSIPAATASADGYMTSGQASTLNTAILALTWEE